MEPSGKTEEDRQYVLDEKQTFEGVFQGGWSGLIVCATRLVNSPFFTSTISCENEKWLHMYFPTVQIFKALVPRWAYWDVQWTSDRWGLRRALVLGVCSPKRLRILVSSCFASQHEDMEPTHYTHPPCCSASAQHWAETQQGQLTSQCSLQNLKSKQAFFF